MNKNNMNDIKGAIFDLDGTVFDSMHIWSDIGLRFLKEKGVEPEPGIEDDFVKMSMTQAAEYYIKNIDPTETVLGIVEAVNKLVEGFYYNDVLLKDGVKVYG